MVVAAVAAAAAAAVAVAVVAVAVVVVAVVQHRRLWIVAVKSTLGSRRQAMVSIKS
jgi:hypothetical protein